MLTRDTPVIPLCMNAEVNCQMHTAHFRDVPQWSWISLRKPYETLRLETLENP